MPGGEPRCQVVRPGVTWMPWSHLASSGRASYAALSPGASRVEGERELSNHWRQKDGNISLQIHFRVFANKYMLSEIYKSLFLSTCRKGLASRHSKSQSRPEGGIAAAAGQPSS